MSCGVCCSPLRPRYKRLVDSIFPDYHEDGLVNNNMQKLIYYAATSPEKLDRIGEYLAQKIERFLYRSKFGFVTIGMEAMDQLLKACASQWLNLYVEFYLRTVQRLLENAEPKMQIRATESFLYFAQKEEDVPAYHRRYDFFISKFSQMCHFETNDPSTTTQIRVSGLQGIGGVVRKIVNEDLAENIWHSQHMDKIIPSLLYNIQIADYKGGQGRSQTPDLGALSAEQEMTSPLRIAEDTLRKLIGRATFTSIRSVIRPVLQHMDKHQMWTPPDFPEHVFRIIVFSIAQNVNYIIIEMLMTHLGQKSHNTKVRCGIATVLSGIFTSRAIDASVGPSVLETINSLLTHLRTSVENSAARQDADPDIRRYNEAILAALGEYSSSLPNFQIIEIMIFILSKVPPNVSYEQTRFEPHGIDFNAELQHTLLKGLLIVGEKYSPVQFSSSFPSQLLGPLLSLLRSPEPDVRLLVLKIVQTLVDRKNNLDKLEHPTVDPTDLVAQKANINKQDNSFFMKNGERIYSELFRVMREETNNSESLSHIWTTCSLLLLECNSDENISLQIDLIRDIQELAMSTNIQLSHEIRFCLHGLTISLLAILAYVVKNSDLFEYKERLVGIRRILAAHLLPPLEDDYSPDLDPNQNIDKVIIDVESVRSVLRKEGRRVLDKTGSSGSHGHHSAASNTPSLRNSRQNSPRHSPRNSWIESNVHRRPSSVSVNSVALEVDSCASSPGIIRKPPNAEVSFYALKKALQEPTNKEAEERTQKLLKEKYLTASFAELCEFTSSSKPRENLNQYLSELFSRQQLYSSEIITSLPSYDTVDLNDKKQKPIYEEYFPEMFMY